MSSRDLFSTILWLALLATPMVTANAQVTEQSARKQATDIVRSELESTINFKSDEFLRIWRDEELEQTLEVAVGGQSGLVFIYKVSPEGVEFKKDAVVYHMWCDFEPVFFVVINPRDGSAYRIHDFGLEQSLAEFERLVTALKVHVASSDQAESLAEFYRDVNPENYASLTPVLSLMELKQAAEVQCQSGAKSFDSGEKAFAGWWRHAEPLYADLLFQPKAIPSQGGYLVDWIVLSTPSKSNCGGSPLHVRLQVSQDGHIGKPAFSPITKR